MDFRRINFGLSDAQSEGLDYPNLLINGYVNNTLGLPVIVVYPDYSYNSSIANNNAPNAKAKTLWDKLPVFRDNRHKVPTAHVPMDKEYITRALNDPDFTIQNISTCYCYCY